MGYLIPVTPQAFVNRISIFGPDETNIKEISYQLSLHLTIPINILTPPKSLELYISVGSAFHQTCPYICSCHIFQEVSHMFWSMYVSDLIGVVDMYSSIEVYRRSDRIVHLYSSRSLGTDRRPQYRSYSDRMVHISTPINYSEVRSKASVQIGLVWSKYFDGLIRSE